MANNNQTEPTNEELKVFSVSGNLSGIGGKDEYSGLVYLSDLRRYGDLKTQQALKSPLIANALALAKKEGELLGVRTHIPHTIAREAIERRIEQEIKQIKTMPPTSGKSGNLEGLPSKMEARK